jgi:hypothetical protein
MTFIAGDCALGMPKGPSPFGGAYVGKDEVRRAHARWFSGLPKVHYGNPVQLVAEDIGISKWLVTGIIPAGDEIEVCGCDFSTLVCPSVAPSATGLLDDFDFNVGYRTLRLANRDFEISGISFQNDTYGR